MSSEAPLNVIIIGAGSTGLLLAQGLSLHSIPYSLYERETPSTYNHRPREWGMSLHWGSSPLSSCLPPSMRSRLHDAISCDPYHAGKDVSVPFFNGKTGERLFDMPGDAPRRVSRRKLRAFLGEGVRVEYGKRLASLSRRADGQIEVRFEDGTTASGDLVVGCDGARSAVRACLVGADAAACDDLDIQMFNVTCAFPRETALLQRTGHRVFKNAVHPGGFMWWQSIQDVPDPEVPEGWKFQNLLSWVGKPRAEDLPDGEARLRFWREVAEGFAEPWRSVGRDLPDDLAITVDPASVWAPNMDWSKGEFGHRVTLAGDAAHAMPPHRGQGLNNALQDAADLVAALAAVQSGEQSLDDGVAAYEKGMRERTLEEIPVSIKQAHMSHDFDVLMQAPFVKHGMHKYQLKKEREELAGESGVV